MLEFGIEKDLQSACKQSLKLINKIKWKYKTMEADSLADPNHIPSAFQFFFKKQKKIVRKRC